MADRVEEWSPATKKIKDKEEENKWVVVNSKFKRTRGNKYIAEVWWVKCS